MQSESIVVGAPQSAAFHADIEMGCCAHAKRAGHQFEGKHRTVIPPTAPITGAISAMTGGANELEEKPKEVVEAEKTLAAGYSGVVTDFHTGDPALGVPAFPQAPVCESALEAATGAYENTEKYSHALHEGCAWLCLCASFIPLMTGPLMLMESVIGGVVEFARCCFCFLPQFAGHVDALKASKFSKDYFSDFYKKEKIDKIEKFKSYLAEPVAADWLGVPWKVLPLFKAPSPNELFEKGFGLNAYGVSMQSLGSLFILIVMIFLFEDFGMFGVAAIIHVLVGFVTAAVNGQAFVGIKKTIDSLNKAKEDVNSACTCYDECKGYWDAGGADSLAEATAKVGGEVKAIVKATKTIEEYEEKQAKLAAEQAKLAAEQAKLAAEQEAKEKSTASE